MDLWYETQLQGLVESSTQAEFSNILQRAASEIGFDTFSYGIRAPVPISNPKILMVNSYPVDWQTQYAERDYVKLDPTVLHGIETTKPLIWSDSVFSSCRNFWEEARSYGLNVGWAQSCHDARGIGGMLTLSRSHEALTYTELKSNYMKMTWLAHAAHESLADIVVDNLVPSNDITLTKREVEVLRWTADGKTSEEIAEIMNISKSTVNFHVNNAIGKLGTPNKTAATIRAVMLKLL